MKPFILLLLLLPAFALAETDVDKLAVDVGKLQVMVEQLQKETADLDSIRKKLTREIGYIYDLRDDIQELRILLREEMIEERKYLVDRMDTKHE